MQKSKTTFAVLALTSLFVLPLIAQNVITTSGQIKVIKPPASVTRSGLQDNNFIYAFPEAQNVTLASPLSVNISVPGEYFARDHKYTPTVFPKGAKVNSYFIESNTVGTQTFRYSGSITFKTQVIGLIVGDAYLDASDAVLGAAGTLYPTHDPKRGLDQVNPDSISLSNDRKTVKVLFETHKAIDEVRVITSASGAPIPTATPTSRPTLTPRPTATPHPTPIPRPTSTPKPTVTPKPTATPRPTKVPRPTPTPRPTKKPRPTATPAPAA